MCGRLDYYLDAFSNLPSPLHSIPPGTTRDYAARCSCSLLLLAVLDQIDCSELLRNFILPSAELEAKYVRYQVRVNDQHYQQPSCAIPFWNLRKTSFWEIRPKPTVKQLDENNVYSMSELRRLVYGAILDQELYTLLQMRTSRDKLKSCLIDSCRPAHLDT